MQCPVCKSVLENKKQESVEYHMCSECFGIWVTDQQFQALAMHLASKLEVKPCAELKLKPREVKQQSPENHPSRICPLCNAAMKEINYAYDSNIFLDRCDICKGIWLDPYEIVDVAKHIQSNPEAEAIAKSFLDFKRETGKSQKDIAREARKGLRHCDSTIDVFWL